MCGCSLLDDCMLEIGSLERLLESDDHAEVVSLGDFNADLRFNKTRARLLDIFVSDYNMAVVGMDDPAQLGHLNTWHSTDFCSQTGNDYYCVQVIE